MEIDRKLFTRQCGRVAKSELLGKEDENRDVLQ